MLGAKAPRFSSLERTTLSPERSEELAASTVHPVGFSVGSMPLEVRFSEERTAADFLDRFADVPAYPSASSRAAAVRLHVVERGDEALFWAAPSFAWRWSGGPLEARFAGYFADSALYHEVLHSTPTVGFHAAVLATHDACAAVTGKSGAGKTTTAVACARRGLRFYADELCVFQGARVIPHLRRLNLRPGARGALLADESGADAFTALLASPNDSGEVLVRPSQLFGPQLVGGPPLPLRCIFIVDGEPSDVASVTATTLIAAAPALALSLSTGKFILERLAHLVRALRKVEVYRLRLGTPAATARTIEAILARARSTVRT